MVWRVASTIFFRMQVHHGNDTAQSKAELAEGSPWLHFLEAPKKGMVKKSRNPGTASYNEHDIKWHGHKPSIHIVEILTCMLCI